MIENKPDPAERRQYFRIDDTISVSVTRIPADQVERRLASLEQTEGTDFTVMSSLSAITAQMAVHLRRIENTQPVGLTNVEPVVGSAVPWTLGAVDERQTFVVWQLVPPAALRRRVASELRHHG